MSPVTNPGIPAFPIRVERTTPGIRRREPRAATRSRTVGAAIVFGLASGMGGDLHAAGEVTNVLVEDSGATPFRYSVDGRTYTWGAGANQLMTGFVSEGESYGYAQNTDRVELQRDDIVGVTDGVPCGVFVQRLDSLGESLAADYPSDGSDSGRCDMAAMLASRVVNRGAVDLFSNVRPDAKNIERVDFLFDHGLIAPVDPAALARAGHAVGEKRGNNPIGIAAILALDAFGQPAAYGPLARVSAKYCTGDELCYGVTDLEHEYSFFQNEFRAPQGYLFETERSVENVTMAFVSARRLGLGAGQRYYGFSLFGDDVVEGRDVLTDPESFPNDTSDNDIAPGDGADIYGGLAGYFVADAISIVGGRIYLDANGDGAFGDGDAGLSDIGVTLHRDDGDGVFDPVRDESLADEIDSGLEGSFRFPGLADGNYFLVLNEADPELPGGLSVVPGTNPLYFTVASMDVDDLDFVFEGDAGSTGGTGTAGTSGGGDASGDGGDSSGDGGDSSGDGGDTSGDGGDTAGDGGDTSGDGGDTSGGGPDLGDSSTDAVSDSFSVNQGESALVDVLANDFDGANAGLTIESVGESPNATIVIEDGQVRYTPVYGFYGSDTFVYTIADADGTRDTATVSARVLRFSDIDGNGINDFDECGGCSEITLETGVDGSGLGSVSARTLALLGAFAALAGLRRRRMTARRDGARS